MEDKPNKLSGCSDVLAPAKLWHRQPLSPSLLVTRAQTLAQNRRTPSNMSTGSRVGASARPDMTVIDSLCVWVCVCTL